jgi:hypothetical protein
VKSGEIAPERQHCSALEKCARVSVTGDRIRRSLR